MGGRGRCRVNLPASMRTETLARRGLHRYCDPHLLADLPAGEHEARQSTSSAAASQQREHLTLLYPAAPNDEQTQSQPAADQACEQEDGVVARGHKHTAGQLGQVCSTIEEQQREHEAAESASAVAVQPAGEVADIEDIYPQPTSAQTRVSLKSKFHAYIWSQQRFVRGSLVHLAMDRMPQNWVGWAPEHVSSISTGTPSRCGADACSGSQPGIVPGPSAARHRGCS